MPSESMVIVCVCVRGGGGGEGGVELEEMGCDNLELNSDLSLILFDAFLVICTLIILGVLVLT